MNLKANCNHFIDNLSPPEAPSNAENHQETTDKMQVASELEQVAERFPQSTPLRVTSNGNNFKLPLPLFTDCEVTSISEVGSREVRQNALEASVLKTPVKEIG